MRSSRFPIATTIVVGLLLAACSSTASPDPVTTSAPAPLDQRRDLAGHVGRGRA